MTVGENYSAMYNDTSGFVSLCVGGTVLMLMYLRVSLLWDCPLLFSFLLNIGVVCMTLCV